MGHAGLSLAIAAVLLFVLMRLTPGDPLARLAEERPVTAQESARLRAMYGLDRPIVQQLAIFASGALRGDLGVSIEYGRPVTALLRERLPATLLLGVTVLLVNFTLGPLLGVWQALRYGRRTDRVLSTVSLALYAMPSFWLGLMLAWLIGVHWRLLPVAGAIDPMVDPDAGGLIRIADLLRHLVLPALTLSAVSIGAAMRYQRAAMLDALGLPCIATARAKGLQERRVVWRHAWRNALFPLLTLFGLWLPLLVTGSVFVEAVFAWPGLGSLAAAAVGGRDYPVIMGASLLAALVLVGGSLMTDFAYALLDPRVRLG